MNLEVSCLDWRDQPAHVRITVTEAGHVLIVAPPGESFTLNALQAERFSEAYDATRKLAAEVQERRSS